MWQHRAAGQAAPGPSPAAASAPLYAFDGPPPESAYAGAPGIGDELETLIRAQVEVERAAVETEYGQAEHREHLLRWAAVRDRIALQAELPGELREGAERAAAHAADRLQAHDHVWDGQAGPYGPRSPEWDLAEGGRAYVRQEYAAWRAATRRRTP
ncbi:hypothetical protein F7Q99_39000 [Streptomyces kaniharaensis]|uniref:Uncharacterized protein n=1 Tax=Streptomyces kaniharaensis TaxID=212423 RepID=A0A6N7L320_9ACTN|nr:hypothetical protein [Streptomyces kaniharaensis]